MFNKPLGLELLRRLAVGGAVASCLLAGEALGQAEVPANPPPAGTPEAPPEKIEPAPPATVPDNTRTPSDELSRTQGVITPPKGVDPGLVKPPPDAGAAKTPVIPPPATQPQ